MNEKIKELAEQALVYQMTVYEYDGVRTYGEREQVFDKEKFAELIIRECADVAYKTSWDDLTHGYGQAVIPLHLHNTIKEHFGVEE